MNPKVKQAQALARSAMLALKNGDPREARRLAELALALDPRNGQACLVLAYLSGPKEAEFYLKRATALNPKSAQVRSALEWVKRQRILAEETTQPIRLVPNAGPTQPLKPARAPSRPTKKGIRLPLARIAAGLGLVAVLAGLALFNDPVLQANSQDNAIYNTAQVIWQTGQAGENSTALAPTNTPQPSATLPPSPTASSTPTSTPTPTFTPTPTTVPSATPTATPPASPSPTQPPPAVSSRYTVKPGDNLYLIAQNHKVSVQDLLDANNLSGSTVIYSGQVLTIPAAGQPPAVLKGTATPLPPNWTNAKGKKILIDISEQHLYAYEENKQIFSFVASTGIGNSTRLGTFKVLDKIPRAYSSRFNIWMPYWLGIYFSGTLENGIHGLPLLMNGVELWGNLLGHPATYGCIESKTSEIKQLYEWAEIGIPVIIQP